MVDYVSRECRAEVPDMSISARRVVRALIELIAQHGKPGMIVSESGSELTRNAVLAWCGEIDRVALHRAGEGRCRMPLGYATPAAFAAELDKQWSASSAPMRKTSLDSNPN